MRKYLDLAVIAFSKGMFYLYGCKHVGTSMTDEELETALKSNPYVIGLVSTLFENGYKLDRDSIETLLTSDENSVRMYVNSIDSYVRDIKGFGEYKTLFPGFPERVSEMSDIEFYVLQLMHYAFGVSYVGNEESLSGRVMPPLPENCVEIRYSDAIGLASAIKSMLSANTSLTEFDREALEYVCKGYGELVVEGVGFGDIFPEDIPFKETLCFVSSLVPNYRLKTATDVLRVAVWMSGGDVSLTSVPKGTRRGPYCYDDNRTRFRKMNRSERRSILSRLERVIEVNDSYLEDMSRHIGMWIRLGEILHPGEYANVYPKTAKAFWNIRNCAKYITTFNSRLENARVHGTMEDMSHLLLERPGEFFRHINMFYSMYKNEERFIEVLMMLLNECVKVVSGKVLYSIRDYCMHRNNEHFMNNRLVIAKSSRYPTVINDLESMDENVLNAISIAVSSEISRRYANKLGAKKSSVDVKYFIDERLRGILCPFNMRSSSKSMIQLPRWSYVPFPEGSSIIRAYLKWHDDAGDIDLDLSASMFSESNYMLYKCGWNSTRMSSDGVNPLYVFSGDVRNREGDNAEYIDIDIDRCVKEGIRYVSLHASDYNRSGFSNVKSTVGTVALSEIDKNSAGDTCWRCTGCTDETAFSISSDEPNSIVCVLDLLERRSYVVDLGVNGLPVMHTRERDKRELINLVVEMCQIERLDAVTMIEDALRGVDCDVVVTTADEIETCEEMISIMKAACESIPDKINELRSSLDESDNPDRIREQIELEELILSSTTEMIDAIHIIKYSDLAFDYTKLFDWMVD